MRTADYNAENLTNHLLIRTKTVPLRCGGHTYFVDVTDGSRSASFISDGKDRLQFGHFVRGHNAAGIEFWHTKMENPETIHKTGEWKNGQDKNEELMEMKNFISRCLLATISYKDVGEKFYRC